MTRRPLARRWSSSSARDSSRMSITALESLPRQTQLPDPWRPALHGAVRERALDALQGAPVEAAAEVAGVEQGDPDSLGPRRLDQRLAEVVAVPVQVVEFANRRDARVQHLAEDGSR